MLRSNDPAAADHLIAVVKDGGLAGSDGALGASNFASTSASTPSGFDALLIERYPVRRRSYLPARLWPMPVRGGGES